MSNDGSSIPREEDLFQRALDIESVEARREYLDKACGNNRELRDRLEILLSVSSISDDVLDSPTNVCDEFLRTKATAFGELTLVRQIGHGGMGVVYEAVQTSLNRHVAVKILPFELRLSTNALERFQREVLAAARLHHPNIVTVYFAGQQDGIPYYAMDLVRGPSLDLVIRHLPASDAKGSLRSPSIHTTDTVSDPFNQAFTLRGSGMDDHSGAARFNSSTGSTLEYYRHVARLFAGVAEGLSHAHSHGVIHRDIKPSNLLLSPDGRLCISDFGLARLADDTSHAITQELLGTPRYMSPEQLTGDRDLVDHRTDIYSLGITLYELLTLRPAYVAEQREQVLTQIVNKDPIAPRRINSTIPVALETICQRAIEKSPGQRYVTAQSLADDLWRFANQQPILARPVGPLTRVARAWHRHISYQATWWLVSCTMIALIAFGIWRASESKRQVKDRYAETIREIDFLLLDKPWEATVRTWEALRDYPQQRSELEQRLSHFEGPIEIVSEPRGAEISVRPVEQASAEWLTLGNTPVHARLPQADYYVRVRLPGHDELTVVRTWSIYLPRTLSLTLSQTHGMVAIPANFEDDDCRIAWLRSRKMPAIAPFEIDRFEVSNREYQIFVDAGGYQQGEWWLETLGENWRVALEPFVDSTGQPGPKSWVDGRCPPQLLDDPVVGVSWYEAMAYAKWSHRCLPTLFHWLHAAGFNGNVDVSTDWLNRYANIDRRSYSPRPRVASALNLSDFGALEMSGNVKEWCLTEQVAGQRYAMGGSWRDDNSATYAPYSLAPETRRDDVGFRCARYTDQPALAASQPIHWKEFSPPPTSLAPHRDEFLFDRSLPWNETRTEHARYHGFPAQRLQFDAPYGHGERITCYLMLPDPTRFAPPYQLVIGSTPIVKGNDGHAAVSNEYIPMIYREFVTQGRAVLMPGYWGNTFERSPAFSTWYPDVKGEDEYRQGMIRVVQDFIRVTDFMGDYNRLFDQSVIDADAMAFVVCGQANTLVALVADELVTGRRRFKAVFFSQGGLLNCDYPADVDPANYAAHLRIPTIFVNRERDQRLTYQRQQRVMYDRIPLVDTDTKMMYVDPSGVSAVPIEHIHREVNLWFNRWLGNPKRASVSAGTQLVTPSNGP